MGVTNSLIAGKCSPPRHIRVNYANNGFRRNSLAQFMKTQPENHETAVVMPYL